MSEEFLKVARQEIQEELDSLKEAFHACANDEQFYKKSKEIERHMHKIKGLAPMMGQENVGEIARMSDLILKQVITQGTLRGSHDIILEAVQKMNHLFNEDDSFEIDVFRKKIIDTYPEITDF